MSTEEKKILIGGLSIGKTAALELSRPLFVPGEGGIKEVFYIDSDHLKMDDYFQSNPIQYELFSSFSKKLSKEFNSKLKEYLTKNLSHHGYHFFSDDELYKFIKNRVTRIGFEDRPYYYEIYIDYVDADNMGKFVGSYSDNVNITQNGNTFTATIGTDFK